MISYVALFLLLAQGGSPFAVPLPPPPSNLGSEVVPVAPRVPGLPPGLPPGLSGGVLPVPADGEEVGYISSSIKWIVSAWKNKEYGPAFAAIIMLLLTAANLLVIRLGKEIRAHWMPVVSTATGIGVALAISIRAIPSGASWVLWLTAIGQGAIVGLAATGTWELIGRKLFAKFVVKAKDKAAAKKAPPTSSSPPSKESANASA